VTSVSDDGKVQVWDLRVKKRAARSFDVQMPQTAVAMSVDGYRTYAGGVDNIVRAWDWRMDGGAPVLALTGHEDTITGLAVSPCGAFVLSNSMDQTLRLWDTRAYVESAREVNQFVGHSHNFEKALIRCAFNADGTRVAAGSSDSCVYVWDVENAKLKYKLPGHKGTVMDVAFSAAENPVLASGGADGVVYVGELDR
jgi:Prp8 binding protein